MYAPLLLARQSAAFTSLRPMIPTFRRMLATNDGDPEPMANIYQQWSLEDDQVLFENRNRKSLPELASILGRGLQGVKSRLDKLTDVDSSAYIRLFGGNGVAAAVDSNDDGDEKGDRLVPAKEVLRRIQWDYSLPEADFSVLYYDRVDDKILETKMDSPNESVEGNEAMFVFAIPEHRIEAVKYKERIVWDKENRIDRVFGSGFSGGETIDQVLESYDEWKQRKDATEEWNRQRQKEVSARIQRMLGPEKFDVLKELSSSVLKSSQDDEIVSLEGEARKYVSSALQVFQEARREAQHNSPDVVPESDYDALDNFSELVALLPNSDLRPAILLEISVVMNRSDSGKKSRQGEAGQQLVELNEEEITENFVRGSGAGGQKINKTSNKVVLVHEPTQLRVECQDTRSLQQNRKIARKRLRLKLDDFLNGNESRTSIKAKKASSKKAKAKARNKARQKKKKKNKESKDV